jgi:hypothetical protein
MRFIPPLIMFALVESGRVVRRQQLEGIARSGRKDVASLLARFAETWRDAIRDIVLIVLSIIIAFSVDTWWEGLGASK